MFNEYGYLVAAANEMHLAYIRRNEAGVDLARAANLGCDIFRELLQDKAFLSDVAMLGEICQSREVEADAMIGNGSHQQVDPPQLDSFQNFLIAEKRIMIAGGMESDLVEVLIREAIHLTDQIRVERLDPELMNVKLEKLRRIACKVADSLRRQHNYEIIWGNLWKLTIAAGGCAIVGLNASSLVATIGLSAAGRRFLVLSEVLSLVLVRQSWFRTCLIGHSKHMIMIYSSLERNYTFDRAS